MALVLADRVQETTTTAGTGALTLDGAVGGFQSFAVVGNGNICYYTIVDGTSWEVGIGTYSTTGPTLSRTTVLSNSSGTTSPLTLSSAAKPVFLTYPAEKSVNLDSSGNVSALGTVSSGTWQGSTVGVAYGGTGVTSSSGANSVVLRDANQNVSINRLNQSTQTITASGGTTVLTAASAFNQALVGTGGQTFQLPDATTLTDTTTFQFNNNATGTLTITDYANATVGTISPGGAAGIALLANATVGGTWDVHAYIPENVTWGTNSLALGSTVITGGTWNGGTITPAYGGTGLTSYTSGGAIYATGTSTLTSGTLPIASGGTGATTVASAQSNLNVLALTGGTLTGKLTAGSADGDSIEVRNDTANSSASGYITFKNKNSVGVYRPAARISGVNVDNAYDGDFLIETYSGGVAYKGLRVDENSDVFFYDTSGNTKFQWDSVNIRALINGYVVLTAANYNSYAPTLTGGGASGTWNINITGSAGSVPATSVTNLYSPNGASVVAADSAMPAIGQSLISTLALGPGGNDGHIIGMSWANTTSVYGAQLWLDTDPTNRMSLRSRSSGGVWNSWADVITSWSDDQVKTGYFQSNSSLRAPIFYDSNDTGYYVDPSGSSYLYSLILSGATYFRPSNWIQLDGSYGLYWPNNYGAHIHANDLSTYTQIALRGGKNSYGGIFDQYSGVNGIMYDNGGSGGVYREANGRWYWYYTVGNDCMGIGTSNTSSTYSLYLTKGVYAQSRIDAPIFYDSNDTAYYIDANSTSSVVAIRGYRYSVGNTDPYDATNNSPWYGLGMSDVSGPFGGTAVQLGGYYGVRIRTANGNMQFESPSYGGAGWLYWTYATAVSNELRATIYYDYSDTAFYCDPNNTSNFNVRLSIQGYSGYSPSYSYGLQLGANAGITPWNFNPAGSSEYRNLTFFATGWDGSSVVTRNVLTIGNYGGFVGIRNDSPNYELDISGTGYASSSLRAPIFYDSNDTGYYVDPNSTSNLTTVAVQNYFSVTTGRATSDYGYAANFVNSQNGASNYTPFNFESTYGNHSWGQVARFRIANGGQDRPSIQFSVAGTDNRWNVGYCYSDDNFRITQNMGMRNDGTSDSWGTQRFLIDTSGNVYMYASARSPIFYDSDDTSYYVDPNSTTQLHYVLANNWFRAQGDTGLYFQSYGYGLWASTAGGNPYGNVTTYGVGRNSWTGYGLGSRITLMTDTNNGGTTTGLHDSNVGWYWRYVYDSYFSVDRGYSTFANSARAPIFYDSDDTGFYINPNGVSNVSSICTGAWYFRSNYNTASSSSPPLQAYSDNGSGAVMAFHRSGYYAVNFGLDSDNVIRIGGWSASANRLQMDMSGNLTMAGNVTAYSDERMKKDWADLPSDFVERLARVKSGTYTRIDGDMRQVGVGAQSLQPLMEEAVYENADGTLSVAYGNAALASSVELAKYVTALEQRISQLEARL